LLSARLEHICFICSERLTTAPVTSDSRSALLRLASFISQVQNKSGYFIPALRCIALKTAPCLQSSRSHARTQRKGKTSVVDANGHFNIPEGTITIVGRSVTIPESVRSINLGTSRQSSEHKRLVPQEAEHEQPHVGRHERGQLTAVGFGSKEAHERGPVHHTRMLCKF
jgi:hypothetical protein